MYTIIMGARLTSLPFPRWYPSQVSLFSKDSLHTTPALSFNPHHFLDSLKARNGTRILGIELGGDKLTSQLYEVVDQDLVPVSRFNAFYSKQGKGYLKELEKLAAGLDPTTHVGISFAGPLDHKTKSLHAAPNMQVFFREFLESPYQGKLENLFASPFTLVNDAVATTLTASVSMAKKDKTFTGLLLIIIGSGLGGAMWYQDKKDAHILACEPGHIPVIPQLNPFKQTIPCPLLQSFSEASPLLRNKVCIEHVAAGKAGIESVFEQETHKHLSGEEISGKYQQGHRFATELYDLSANIVAHTIEGMIKTFRFSLQSTVIALHGGVTLVPDYSERVVQIIQRNISASLNVIETKNITKHSGNMGAALAALISE